MLNRNLLIASDAEHQTPTQHTIVHPSFVVRFHGIGFVEKNPAFTVEAEGEKMNAYYSPVPFLPGFTLKIQLLGVCFCYLGISRFLNTGDI